MTVGELKEALTLYRDDANVYIPDLTDGTIQIAALHGDLAHLGLEETMPGVAIPDDMYLIPASMGLTVGRW
jgi:hypothetical protein